MPNDPNLADLPIRSVGDAETLAPALPNAGTPPPAPPPVPGYEILGVLGRGGMGVVYQARHLALKRVVALKMILAGGHASELQLARFRTEAEAVARLQHPGIVQVFEVGETNGLPWCSLEFCTGGSLQGKLADNPMSPTDAARMLVSIARAMHACHQAGILHRDLKPANILLDGDGKPKVTDFGLAKALDSETGQTQSGAILGTPSYMPPEQARGDSDELGPVSDVYSLGAILYELLVGRPPFRGATVRETIVQVLADDPVPPRQFDRRIPRDLETICLKALRKQPKQRYASAADLADDLERYLDGKPVVARPISAATQAVKWVRRRPVTSTAIALTVLVAVLGAGLWVQREQNALAEAGRRAEQSEERGKQEAQINSVLRSGAKKMREATEMAGIGKEKSDPKLVAEARVLWQQAQTQLKTASALLDKAAFEPEPGLRDQVAEQLAVAERESRSKDRDIAFAQGYPLVMWLSFAVAGEDKTTSRKNTAAAAEKTLDIYGLSDLSQDDSPERFAALDSASLPAPKLAGDVFNLLLLWAQAESPVNVGETDLDAVVEAVPEDATRRADRLLRRADTVRRLYAGQPDAPKFAERTLSVRRAAYLAQLGQADEAKAERERAKNTPARAAFDFVLKGTAEEQAGRPDSAIESTKKALNIDPSNADALFLQGLCYLRTGQYGPAINDLQNCLAKRPEGEPWIKTYLGFARLQMREYDMAANEFEKSLDLATGSPKLRFVVLNNLGVLRQRQERFEEARKMYADAISLFPNEYLTYTNLATLHASREDYPAALASYDQAIERAPNLGVLHYQRARIQLRSKRSAEALADFQASVKLDGPDEMGKDGPIGTSWEQQTRKNRHTEAHIQAGRLLHEGKQFEPAIREYDRALKLQPGYALVHRLKAESYRRLGLFKATGEELDKYVDIRPDATAAVHVMRGVVYQKEGKFTEAVEAYTLAASRLHRSDPDIPGATDPTEEATVKTQRGWAYMLLDAAKLAENDFDDVVKANHTHADALAGRANARIKLGQTAKAVADAEEALKYAPPKDLGDLSYKTARVYAMACGQVEAASKGTRTGLDLTYQYQERAVTLLRQAMERWPAEDRGRFWRETVQKDPAFVAIRRSTNLIRLAGEMAAKP